MTVIKATLALSTNVLREFQTLALRKCATGAVSRTRATAASAYVPPALVGTTVASERQGNSARWKTAEQR